MFFSYYFSFNLSVCILSDKLYYAVDCLTVLLIVCLIITDVVDDFARFFFLYILEANRIKVLNVSILVYSSLKYERKWEILFKLNFLLTL